jgi:hypothetical protein
MHMAPDVLASRNSLIRENLNKMKESVDGGFFKDALRYATQFCLLSRQLASELESTI